MKCGRSIAARKLAACGYEATKQHRKCKLAALLLKVFPCDFKAERDAEILRSIKTLGSTNGKPAKDFWKEVEQKKP
jgi:hypothetical protein